MSSCGQSERERKQYSCAGYPAELAGSATAEIGSSEADRAKVYDNNNWDILDRTTVKVAQVHRRVTA